VAGHSDLAVFYRTSEGELNFGIPLLARHYGSAPGLLDRVVGPLSRAVGAHARHTMAVRPDACQPSTGSGPQCTQCTHESLAEPHSPAASLAPRPLMKSLWASSKREPLSYSEMAAALELPAPSSPSPPLGSARAITEALPLPLGPSPRTFRGTAPSAECEPARDQAFSFAEPASYFAGPSSNAGTTPQ
jgi:hypothetical protein